MENKWNSIQQNIDVLTKGNGIHPDYIQRINFLKNVEKRPELTNFSLAKTRKVSRMWEDVGAQFNMTGSMARKCFSGMKYGFKKAILDGGPPYYLSTFMLFCLPSVKEQFDKEGEEEGLIDEKKFDAGELGLLLLDEKKLMDEKMLVVLAPEKFKNVCCPLKIKKESTDEEKKARVKKMVETRKLRKESKKEKDGPTSSKRKKISRDSEKFNEETANDEGTSNDVGKKSFDDSDDSDGILDGLGLDDLPLPRIYNDDGKKSFDDSDDSEGILEGLGLDDLPLPRIFSENLEKKIEKPELIEVTDADQMIEIPHVDDDMFYVGLKRTTISKDKKMESMIKSGQGLDESVIEDIEEIYKKLTSVGVKEQQDFVQCWKKKAEMMVMPVQM